MGVRVNMLRLASLIALTAASWSAPAGAANWLEKTFYMTGPRYDAVLPACTEHSALDTIQSRFATKESRFWNSNLQIVGFEKIREVAFRPWAEATIPRRFCAGRALVSDGRWHNVYYSIDEDGGLIGATWDVTWCVQSFDRNRAYSPNCKMAQP